MHPTAAKLNVRRRFDHVMHKRLTRIFNERCLSTGDQTKEFLRGLRHNAEEDSRIKRQILKKERVFSKKCSKEDVEKLSLLWIAVFSYCYDSAELLVRSGADVNEPYGLQQGCCHGTSIYLYKTSTVLHALLQMDPSTENERLIRLVEDHGADLQARYQDGQTLLHFAVKYCRVWIIQKLLQKGADVNIADNNGFTPILEAARCAKACELVPLLMEHGADAFARDKWGNNILHCLAFSDDEERAVQLSKVFIEMGVSLDDRDNSFEFQPMHLAAYMGHVKMLNHYLDYGADVNAQASFCTFLLYWAAVKCGSYAVKSLIERGVDIDQRRYYPNGPTTLHEVCNRCIFDDETIDLLLSAGANILLEDRNGRTPLALVDDENMKNPKIKLIIKRLALIKVCQPSIELKDERIIAQHSELQDYYQDCIEQIGRAKVARFIHTCTILDLLAKCHCKIAALMRNPEFESKFKLLDLNTSEFATYADDIVRAFERAEKHHRSMLERQDVLLEAFSNILPYVVVRRVVHYICNCYENKNEYVKAFVRRLK